MKIFFSLLKRIGNQNHHKERFEMTKKGKLKKRRGNMSTTDQYKKLINLY